MNQIFAIVFIILLATFSMVNSVPLHIRTTGFTKCITGSPDLITVNLEPDPLVPGENDIFTISGNLTENDITQGSTLKISALDTKLVAIGSTIDTDFCSLPEVTCPTRTFNLKLNVTIGELPSTYVIQVGIYNPAGTTLACVMGVISD